VTRKISSHAAKIKLGLAKELRLGNLDARRDWGHAKDYVKAMWMMLQVDSPEDYVVGTGESHSVMEFVKIVFDYLGLDHHGVVITDQRYYRPAEIYDLVADASKVRSKLGWAPKYRYVDLAQEMAESDLRLFQTNREGLSEKNQ
jgi:GDPmannose 4,6-dehydratase